MTIVQNATGAGDLPIRWAIGTIVFDVEDRAKWIVKNDALRGVFIGRQRRPVFRRGRRGGERGGSRNMDNITQSPIDIDTIIERRKRAWMKEARKSISVQERIAVSVPWWLLVIAGGLFGLSASHSVGVFFQLSPLGYFGPFVVEFALLWAAFARQTTKQEGSKTSWMLRTLEALAFVMAIGVNLIGAINRVAELAKIDTFSFDKIVAQFSALPVTTQGVMLFVPLFALFVPIGTWVAGESLAILFLKQRQSGGLMAEKWREVEREELYRAFYAELVGRNVPTVEARRRAESLSAGFTHGSQKLLQSGDVPVQIEPQKIRVEAVQLKSAIERSRRSIKNQPLGATARVNEYLNEHPEAFKTMSQNQLSKRLNVSLGTVNAVFKSRQNENEKGDV